MTREEIRKLIDELRQTDIEELSWQEGDLKIYIKLSKSEVAKETEPEPKPAISPTAKDATEETKKEEKIIPIKSTMVGIFYHSFSNDHPPFVVEGNKIKVGQKLGVVETLHVYRDVISNINGRIVKIIVQNKQPVEYGQELFLVEKE